MEANGEDSVDAIDDGEKQTDWNYANRKPLEKAGIDIGKWFSPPPETKTNPVLQTNPRLARLFATVLVKRQPGRPNSIWQRQVRFAVPDSPPASAS